MRFFDRGCASTADADGDGRGYDSFASPFSLGRGGADGDGGGDTSFASSSFGRTGASPSSHIFRLPSKQFLQDVKAKDGTFRFVGDIDAWKENLYHIGWATYSRAYGYESQSEQQRFHNLKRDPVAGHQLLFSEFKEQRFRISELQEGESRKWCGDPVTVRLARHQDDAKFGYVWSWTMRGLHLWEAALPLSSPRAGAPEPATGRRCLPDEPAEDPLQVQEMPKTQTVPPGLSLWSVLVLRGSIMDFFRESGLSQSLAAGSIAGRFYDTKNGKNALTDPTFAQEMLDEEGNLRICVDKRLDEREGKWKIFVAPYFRYHELKYTLRRDNVHVQRRGMFAMKPREDVAVAERILLKYCRMEELVATSTAPASSSFGFAA